MKKNNKTITIVALIIAVASLTIGFAAFSSTLTINSSATVTPDASTFNVGFSTAIDSLKPGTLNSSSTLGEPATITGTSITGLKANLKNPGEYADYIFFVYNAGEYDAYLNDIVFKNISGETVNKKCVAGEGATESLVQEACAGIKLEVMEAGYNGGRYIDSTVNNISNTILLKGKGRAVYVKISYLENGVRADGPFTVEFGDITLNYSSVD